MPLIEKKEELNKEGVQEKPGKTPPLKEEKKDTSLYGEKAYVDQERGRMWTRKRETSESTGIKSSEMDETWKKLTKGSGYFLERKEAEDIYKEIKDYPTKSKEKYGIKSEGERFKVLKLLGKSLGK